MSVSGPKYVIENGALNKRNKIGAENERNRLEKLYRSMEKYPQSWNNPLLKDQAGDLRGKFEKFGFTPDKSLGDKAASPAPEIKWARGISDERKKQIMSDLAEIDRTTPKKKQDPLTVDQLAAQLKLNRLEKMYRSLEKSRKAWSDSPFLTNRANYLRMKFEKLGYTPDYNKFGFDFGSPFMSQSRTKTRSPYGGGGGGGAGGA